MLLIRGAGPGCNTQEITERMLMLKEEINELKSREDQLDQHRVWIQQSICNITDDLDNAHRAFVRHEDICNCFDGDTLLAIQAPSGTKLEVPNPDQLVGFLSFLVHYKCIRVMILFIITFRFQLTEAKRNIRYT